MNASETLEALGRSENAQPILQSGNVIRNLAAILIVHHGF
jgi:hypothetical protein